jgi:putative alpha-1,2-mannosidase
MQTTICRRSFLRPAAAALFLLPVCVTVWAAGGRPIDYANPLVGTAPLDDPQLIGSAPPPGEEIYTGFTSPGPCLPHGNVNLCPVNKDLDQATIHLGQGRDFVIVASNNSEKNIYIQSATLNGQPWHKPWFSHADIAGGGRLVFKMGSAPNKTWGSAPEDAPPSMSR